MKHQWDASLECNCCRDEQFTHHYTTVKRILFLLSVLKAFSKVSAQTLCFICIMVYTHHGARMYRSPQELCSLVTLYQLILFDTLWYHIPGSVKWPSYKKPTIYNKRYINHLISPKTTKFFLPTIEIFLSQIARNIVLEDQNIIVI